MKSTLIIIHLNLLIYANRGFEDEDPSHLVGKKIQSLVVEEIIDNIKLLFDKKKQYRTEAKLVNSKVWLNLSMGPINETTATVIATDIINNYYNNITLPLLMHLMSFIIRRHNRNKANGTGIT